MGPTFFGTHENGVTVHICMTSPNNS